jgi:hypothetical protein
MPEEKQAILMTALWNAALQIVDLTQENLSATDFLAAVSNEIDVLLEEATTAENQVSEVARVVVAPKLSTLEAKP